jgi:hypothetical protein
MAIKTFTTGEVLTASDTNTYLANAGLVYVTSTTFSAVSSVQINSCFTSTYDSYKILYRGSGTLATPTNISCQLVDGTTPAATNYYFMVQYQNTSNTPFSYWSGGTTAWQVGWVGDTWSEFVVDLHDPQTTSKTSGHSTGFGSGASQFTSGTYFLLNLNATAYEGIYFAPLSGTMTGTITVYGYRKA